MNTQTIKNLTTRAREVRNEKAKAHAEFMAAEQGNCADTFVQAGERWEAAEQDWLYIASELANAILMKEDSDAEWQQRIDDLASLSEAELNA